MARKMKEISGAVAGKHGTVYFWTRIGVAFENSDGSLNLIFNYWPTARDTTIQIRDPKPAAAEVAAEPGASG